MKKGMDKVSMEGERETSGQLVNGAVAYFMRVFFSPFKLEGKEVGR